MVARLLFVLLAGAWLSTAGAATFTATVDRHELYQDEHLVLTLRLEDSDTRLRAEGIDPNVDLTLLTDDFDLGSPRVSNRFNINRSFGRSTSELVVELFPKRSGQLTIPPFEIDDIATSGLSIDVLPKDADKTPEVFVRADVNKYTVWQREQLVAYADIYHRVELASAKAGGHIDTEPLNIQLRHLPQSERTETVNGIEYKVLRTAWAIFPLLDGKLTVHIPDIWTVTAQNDRQRFPVETKVIDVRPLPAAVPAGMVVGKPELSVAPLTENYTQGELASWTVTLRAPAIETALPSALPALELPDGLKPYASAASRDLDARGDGLTGIAIYTLSVIPVRPGSYTLPPIRFPYFDPQRGIMDVVSVDGPIFQARASGIAANAAALVPPAATPVVNEPPVQTNSAFNAWHGATLLFAALWLATACGWWYSRRKSRTAPEPVPTAQPPHSATVLHHHPLRQRLLAALNSRSLEQGLIEQESRAGPDEELRAVVRAVQRLCYGKGRVVDEAELRRRVDAVIANLSTRDTARTDSKPDHWSPRAFNGTFSS